MSTNSTPRRPSPASIVVVLCVAAAGCGGSDAEHARRQAVPVTEVERVAAAVRQQAQAVASGSGRTACSLFTTKARREFENIVSRRAGSIGCVTAISEGARSLPARSGGPSHVPRSIESKCTATAPP